MDLESRAALSGGHPRWHIHCKDFKIRTLKIRDEDVPPSAQGAAQPLVHRGPQQQQASLSMTEDRQCVAAAL
eukprot:1159743-Pelagomonas_calceolata.AAC.6